MLIPQAIVQQATIPTDGWVDDTGTTWTYASGTTFTVPGDQTVKFSKGTRLKLTQTTVKYFVVVSSSFSGTTTVTISGGDDYSLANAAISSNYYSYASNPQGYPSHFNWTPNITSDNSNFVLNNGTLTGTFNIVGELVSVNIVLTWGSSTSSGTGKLYVVAVPAGSYPSEGPLGTSFGNDSNTSWYAGNVNCLAGRICSQSGGSTAQWRNDTPFTWSTGDIYYWQFQYKLA